jgi:hypothetical protein
MLASAVRNPRFEKINKSMFSFKCSLPPQLVVMFITTHATGNDEESQKGENKKSAVWGIRYFDGVGHSVVKEEQNTVVRELYRGVELPHHFPPSLRY